jgi:UDP-N-acetylmuramate--alanine ligase
MNVVCVDDPGVARLLPRIKRPVLTYGLKKDARLRGEIITAHMRSAFKIYLDGELWGEANLAQPGRHNVLNALGAVGLAMEAGLGKQAILDGLSNFGGVGRRFEKKGERGGVLVVDDYGHHPAEIVATLAAAKACFPERRIVMAFQPHRFTRTQLLFGEFCKAFEDCDLLLLTEIYPASESPIPGVSGLSLAQGIKQVSKTSVRFFPDFEAMERQLPSLLEPGDLLLTQGAGSIWQVGENYLDRVREEG